jgi:hypothetical protein
MQLPIIVGAIVTLCCSAVKPVFAAASSSIRSLRGVHAVRVVVEDLNQEMQKTGLRKEHLRVIAEQQLTKGGLPVVHAQDPGKVPLVYIRLSAVVSRADAHAPLSFYLTVQLKQLGLLPPDRQDTSCSQDILHASRLLVTTWEDGTMVMTDRSGLPFYVQTTLTNLIANLAQDSREANKK